MDKSPFDAAKDLKTEYRGSTTLGKRVTCLPCGLVIFELPDQPTLAEREAEGLRFAAHLEFTHDMVVHRGACADADCDIIHIDAFPRRAPIGGTTADSGPTG
jgi:hypothetical protein